MFRIKNKNRMHKVTAVFLRVTAVVFLIGMAISIAHDFRRLTKRRTTPATPSNSTDRLQTPIYEFVFSPDEKQILCRTNSRQLLLRDSLTGSLIDFLSFEEKEPLAIASSSVVGTFLEGYRDGSLVLWTVEDGDQHYRPLVLGHYDSDVTTCALSKDSRLAASGYFDGRVIITDVRTGDRLQSIQACTSTIFCVRFSPDGRRLLSAGSEISVWDVESGRETARLVGHGSSVKSAVFSPDGRRIVSGGLRDGTLIIWDVDRKTELWRVKNDRIPIYAVAFSPDGKTVAAGDHDGAISLWDVQTQRQIFKRYNGSGNITCLRFSSDAGTLYSASTDGTICVWDISTGLERHRL